MPRFIPIELRDHLRGDATTTCWILRIDPVQPGYASYGVCQINRPVMYDHGDGSGLLEYSAVVGMQPTTLQAKSDLSVDNAEATSLIPEYDIPVSEADIRAGAYDFARWRLFLVNYENPTVGSGAELRAGTIGRVSIDSSGLSYVNELRGLLAELKQSVCEKDSLTCRARFGTQPVGSSTPGPQVEYGWCGFDATSLIVTSTVASVGLENSLTFTIAGFTMGVDVLAPGIVKFTSGLNAGKTYEVDSNTAGGEITLAFETEFPIAAGDGVEYRQDCNKLARDDAKGCKHWFSTNWVLHFRGEPDIPIGDAGSIETPGASSSPGDGGTTYQPISEE